MFASSCMWQTKYDLPTDLTIGAHVVAIEEAKLAKVSVRTIFARVVQGVFSRGVATHLSKVIVFDKLKASLVLVVNRNGRNSWKRRELRPRCGTAA